LYSWIPRTPQVFQLDFLHFYNSLELRTQHRRQQYLADHATSAPSDSA
jgi:hypothetical protein